MANENENQAAGEDQQQNSASTQDQQAGDQQQTGPGNQAGAEETPSELKPLESVKEFIPYIYAVDTAKELAAGKNISLDQALKAMEIGERIRANNINKKTLGIYEQLHETVNSITDAFMPFTNGENKTHTGGEEKEKTEETNANLAPTTTAQEQPKNTTPLHQRRHSNRT